MRIGTPQQLGRDLLWHPSNALRHWISTLTKFHNAAIPVGVADHYADANNGTTVETDLYTDTLAPLEHDGDKITAQYVVTYAANANNKTTKIYFGGTVIYTTGAIARNNAAATDAYHVLIIRESATVVRCVVYANNHSGAVALVSVANTYTRITGLTLTNPQILKITGQSSAASSDITARMGIISRINAV